MSVQSNHATGATLRTLPNPVFASRVLDYLACRNTR